jgi:hypothetical protein
MTDDLEGRLRSALHEETSGLMAHPTMADDLIARGTKVRRRRRVAGGVACVAVLAAMVPVWQTIDHSEGSVQPVGPGPTVSTPTTPPPTSPSIQGPTAWQQLPVQAAHAPKQPARVVNLRVGQHATYDRVVIDFAGAMSGYRIEQVPTLRQDGSGKVVRLPGSDKILLFLDPAVAHTPAGHPSYDGPQRAEYAMPTLRGVAFLGDFEGVSLGLGVDHLTTIRVIELSDPARLVIDLHH